MMVYFADTSALLRLYFPDEEDGGALRALLLDGSDPVIASRLADVETPRAFVHAVRTGVVAMHQLALLLDAFDRDVGSGRRVELLPVEPEVLGRARELVVDNGALRSLDAVHLAAAEQMGRRLAGAGVELVFVTRVEAQRDAADRLGLRTA